jgi:V8-like Glu-specific endopeptidase
VALALATLLDAGVPASPRLLAVDGGRTQTATGFALRDETVVTVAHALTAGPVKVDGRAAAIVRKDDTADVAVLHVPGLRARRLEVADADRLVTAHIDGATREAVVVDADVRPGESGTPVIRRGRLVGVIFARSEDRAHTAYAVAGATLRRALGA